MGGDSSVGDSSGGNTSSGDSSRDLECKDVSKKCMFLMKIWPALCNYEYADTHCAKSCNKCNECQDSSQRCAFIIETFVEKGGKCPKSYEKYCRKSCGFCT